MRMGLHTLVTAAAAAALLLLLPALARAQGTDGSTSNDQLSAVPPGAVMPSNPLSAGAPLPTLNPYAPARPTPTSNDPSTNRGGLRTASFVINNFYIAIAAVTGFVGLVVGVIVLIRWWKGGKGMDRNAINARFEREQVGCVSQLGVSSLGSLGSLGSPFSHASLPPNTHTHTHRKTSRTGRTR